MDTELALVIKEYIRIVNTLTKSNRLEELEEYILRQLNKTKKEPAY